MGTLVGLVFRKRWGFLAFFGLMLAGAFASPPAKWVLVAGGAACFVAQMSWLLVVVIRTQRARRTSPR